MNSQPARVLIVAHRTAATPRLLDVVRERAQRGPCAFEAVREALARERYDEVIVSTLRSTPHAGCATTSRTGSSSSACPSPS